MSVYDKYETVIGLEVHVQLSSLTKAFCADRTTFGAPPNSQTSVISLAHPGTLPRLNKKQVAHAVRLGLALGSEINPKSYFDRKNYFYADLPKGYQITQDNLPICVGGVLPFSVGERAVNIRIHHIHMEEDAGKSIHDLSDHATMIDLNRAGVPLLEVVTEPDFRSPEEVDIFMNTMRQLVRYLEISDGNMEQGSMRCDCNVSVRLKGETTYGERCEIKNMNSMRYARRAIAYESKRQIDLLEAGHSITQQTLNFDPQTGITTPLRNKENAHDYRYFPDPDLAPVVIDKASIDHLRQTLAVLPWEVTTRLRDEFKLPAKDANLLAEEKEIALYFIDLATLANDPKACANLIINKVRPYLQQEKISIEKFPLSQKQLVAFIKLIQTGKLSSSIAYQRIFPALIESPEQTPLAVAERLNLIQSDDEDFLTKIVDEVLAQHPKEVAAYQKGKKNLIGFFMGEVMKKSRGKAAPKTCNALLRKKLA